MMAPENRNELFFSETDHAESRPWWDVPSYLTGPIRFGTWDGVFVSVSTYLNNKITVEYL